MILKQKKVLVFGTGISGIAAAKLLNQVNAEVLIFESNKNSAIDDIKLKLPKNFQGEIIVGELKEEVMNLLDLVVLSPGVPTDLEIVNQLREKNIPIWGEIELAYSLSKGRIAAITGTNGKTTTTTLVGDIMKAYYNSVFIVGNIGIPYTDIAMDTTDESVVVAEMSSFQLETIVDFHPHVSTILNITPDHLNRHHTMENYIEAKLQIARNQGDENVCVLNYEDAILLDKSKTINTNLFFFSSLRVLEKGIYLENENIVYNNGSEIVIVCNVKELNIIGKHNYENVMAGVAIGISFGVPMDCIRKAVLNFVAVEHRIEYVTTKSGVKYYNDSKGTNPDASIKAIEAMETPTILIAGGYDKNSEFEEWVDAFGTKIRCLVLIGETSEKIAKTARERGFTSIIQTTTLEEAVNQSAKHAESGDSVLLSPACASWDMFPNYEVRGKMFKEYVLKL